MTFDTPILSWSYYNLLLNADKMIVFDEKSSNRLDVHIKYLMFSNYTQ